MRAEVFLTNGKKITINDVISISRTNELTKISYEKVGEGEWTTCDEPEMSFENKNVDMIKLFNFY